MDGDSPLKSYRDACNTLQDIQESYEEPATWSVSAPILPQNPRFNRSNRQFLTGNARSY